MLTERILQKDIRAAARLMRRVDDRDPSAATELSALFSHTGRAHIIGVTGNPGSGKSTLVDVMIKELRTRGKTVGVVAVDPSSPFTGGAILGDRIRMQRHCTDAGVFIRSLATRGHLGGLSRSTGDIVTIMDAMGYDVVLIETVGVGQDEVDIIKTAHSSVVVLVPGLGDEIQVMKAGILEIADIFVVNKADRPGAEKIIAELSTLQKFTQEGERTVPILRTVATRNEGVPSVVDSTLEHFEWLKASGEFERSELLRLQTVVDAIMEEQLRGLYLSKYRDLDSRLHFTEKLLDRSVSPYDIAERLMKDLIVEK